MFYFFFIRPEFQFSHLSKRIGVWLFKRERRRMILSYIDGMLEEQPFVWARQHLWKT